VDYPKIFIIFWMQLIYESIRLELKRRLAYEYTLFIIKSIKYRCDERLN
jgi:hypothetical protein